jgi:uracil-DNA glycosylase
VLDATKHLHVLQQEWQQCTNCDLGKRRMSAKRGGNFVFGEGVKGRLMVIGGGPDIDDDASGVPFSGDAGALLRNVLKEAGLEGQYYLTNTVACRSCSQRYNSEGQPEFWRGGEPAIFDHEPFDRHYEECRPRLFEEIYIVDPLLIITLGSVATEVVTRKKLPLQDGEPAVARIPGAGRLPRLTEKKKQWYRKVGGSWVLPSDQNYVEYMVIPTFHPSHVLRQEQDQRNDSPFSVFVKTFKKARGIYNKYMEEIGVPNE